MYKRTKGYFLLLLLVLTGMAGQISIDTLSARERKILVHHLKESQKKLAGSIYGLSEEQLHFKPAPNEWSVEECVQHIALSEYNLWNVFDAARKQPANPEKRNAIKLSDQNVINLMADRTNKVKTSERFYPENAKWKTTTEARDAFNDKRKKLIWYTKNTTDDLRNHIAQLHMGYIDAYQIILLLSAHCNRHVQQIEALKAHPDFPRKVK